MNSVFTTKKNFFIFISFLFQTSTAFDITRYPKNVSPQMAQWSIHYDKPSKVKTHSFTRSHFNLDALFYNLLHHIGNVLLISYAKGCIKKCPNTIRYSKNIVSNRRSSSFVIRPKDSNIYELPLSVVSPYLKLIVDLHSRL